MCWEMRLVATVATLVAALTGPGMAQGFGTDTASRPAPRGTKLDLTKPFHTRSSWRLVVTQGPRTQDFGGNDAPGALTLCLHKGRAGPCISSPVTPPLRTAPSNYPGLEPHYLLAAKLVYPRGPAAAPFLLIITGSLNSGDGDQLIATQVVTYDAAQDAFRRVYDKITGHNNNQEVRFITDGPLRGSLITAQPQEHPPYGYWIVVDSLTPSGRYRQVLRYGSATHYGDGNRLAVIDSEMPNIERRLGLWKPGQPIPAPKLGPGGKPCLKPSLRHGELWCS